MSTTVACPGSAYYRRARMLDALATLAGGFLTAVPGLSDGRTPDDVRRARAALHQSRCLSRTGDGSILNLLAPRTPLVARAGSSSVKHNEHQLIHRDVVVAVTMRLIHLRAADGWQRRPSPLATANSAVGPGPPLDRVCDRCPPLV